jgi:hypothetical protein
MATTENDIEKEMVRQNEVMHDKDILGTDENAKQNAIHFGKLSEEELVLQKKLRRKIDSVIMPMVVLVRFRRLKAKSRQVTKCLCRCI